MSHDHGHHHEHHHHEHHHHDHSRVRAQPVVLDLGAGFGALIVHTVPELLGVEIEISPAGDDGRREHKEVLQRLMGPRVVNVLVYDNLAEGDYTLWIDDRPVARGVHVTADGVAEHDLGGAA
jgi:hypothetical protein